MPFLISIALSLLLPYSAPRDSLVVSTSWLAEHLRDPNLVVLHGGDKNLYDSRHIPGGRRVALADISVSDRSATGLTLEMPQADDLRHRLEALGISDQSRVIVVFDQDWVSPATRVMFTLDYAGLGDRSSLLDGGLDAWIREKRAVTAEVPVAQAGTLSPLKTKPIVVDAAFVRANLATPGIAIVDGRAAALYDGVQTGGSKEQPHKTGHIAGAHSVPFTEIANDDNLLRSPQELEALFTKAGVKPGDTVVGYCHIGQQATAMLFAARTLGHKVLLYDGSFEDWSRHADAPVDNPSARDRK
jgi:thiosulfate/3-mercaptopyruvate sulfurtransferase